MTAEVFIVSATRTPIGAFQGELSTVAAPALGATAVRSALERAKVDADAVEEAYLGNVLSAGIGQAPARQAMKAAGVLESEGIEVEIIDPRTLQPLDDSLICESVKKTGRLVIADVACKTGGVGAEIACRVAESVPEYLKAPVKRINFPDTPTPCSPVLEEAYYPDANTSINTVRGLFDT